MNATTFTRFRAKYDPTPGGCWTWTGATQQGGLRGEAERLELLLGHGGLLRLGGTSDATPSADPAPAEGSGGAS